MFHLFQTYVAKVLFEYCKSRSGILSVVVGPTCHNHLLAVAELACMRVGVEGREWQTRETRASADRDAALRGCVHVWETERVLACMWALA
jgi:hypothetical protein